MEQRGFFFAFEGIDGAGSTTQTHEVARRLEIMNKYQDVLRTHEPWKNHEIKKMLQEDKDAYSNGSKMAKTYIDDRVEHTQRLIRPNLEADTTVLCSRYKLSLVYQWVQGVPLPKLLDMHENRGLLTPDLTFFLDIPLEVAIERRRARTKEEKFERDHEFIRKTISAYRTLALMSKVDPSLFGKVITIDGNRHLETVAEEVFSHVAPLYKIP